MPPATNRETNRTLSGSALRQPQRTSRVFMKEWNQSLFKVVACATLLFALGSCSGGGSGGGEATTCPSALLGSSITVNSMSSSKSSPAMSLQTTPPGLAALSSATLTINSPAQGACLSPGPVLVTFDIQNSPVPPSTTQPRMHFYVDNDPVVYQFFDGAGTGEEGSTSGVRYQGVHTHFVHWK